LSNLAYLNRIAVKHLLLQNMFASRLAMFAVNSEKLLAM